MQIGFLSRHGHLAGFGVLLSLTTYVLYFWKTKEIAFGERQLLIAVAAAAIATAGFGSGSLTHFARSCGLTCGATCVCSFLEGYDHPLTNRWIHILAWVCGRWLPQSCWSVLELASMRNAVREQRDSVMDSTRSWKTRVRRHSSKCAATCSTSSIICHILRS